jgi:hypothetical protein
MEIWLIILGILIGAFEPICYMLARISGMPETKGWKKIIPFIWVFKWIKNIIYRN